MNDYQVLAKAIDYQLGKDFSAAQLAEIQAGINQSRSLVEQAEVHGVAPFFYQFSKQNKLELTEHIKRQLQALTLRHKLAAQTRNNVLALVVKEFEQQKIGLVLLKGAALAHMIYSQPGNRPMRDIDILIRKSDQDEAKTILEDLNFVFDQSYPSIYMGDIHHLPNAIKVIDGMKVSLEVHDEIYSRDVEGNQKFEQIIDAAQIIKINENMQALTLDHFSMLNHLCRHTFSISAEVRLIHQHDIVKYIETYFDDLDWQRLHKDYPFIINTIRCLYYSIYLPQRLKEKISPSRGKKIDGVGQAMLPYTHILKRDKAWFKRIKMLFRPSPWWMHVNYNVAPEKSLLWCYLFYHPSKVISDITSRLLYACKNKLGNLKR